MKTSQRYIIKIHSARLRKAKWRLTLSPSEARQNNEIVTIGDSQILRWIDEFNGVSGVDEGVRSVRSEIKALRKEPSSVPNRNATKNLYRQLDNLLFRPDYMCLVIDKVSDYRRALKGFTINDVEYVRLVGTNGGVKCSTIVFVSKRLAPALRQRIDNGRDPTKKMVPAKFEAYRALTCSGSRAVSMPHGIAVVPDCVTHFKADVINISDENDGEPVVTPEHDADVELKATDGFGLMMPSLAARWSKELGLNYMMPGGTVRYAFAKGMAYTFDFQKFAAEVALSPYISDAWGKKVDLREVELVLTTSMVKLWDSYSSCAEYLKRSAENNYSFGITKVCPEKLENARCLNYQFIQSYHLTDEQIDELIRPTVEQYRNVLEGDWREAVLFLKGMDMSERSLRSLEPDFGTAIMVEPQVFEDKFVKKRIYGMLRKRINDAKIGVVQVHGNYSMMSGDPYTLCQSMCNLPVTGLLKAGEIYSRYWAENEVDTVACFRAPMTHAGNIRRAHIANSSEAAEWYQYMTTVTILNSWDTMCAALNGAD